MSDRWIYTPATAVGVDRWNLPLDEQGDSLMLERDLDQEVVSHMGACVRDIQATLDQYGAYLPDIDGGGISIIKFDYIGLNVLLDQAECDRFVVVSVGGRKCGEVRRETSDALTPKKAR